MMKRYAIIAVFFIQSFAFANDIYVDVSWGGATSGTITEPFITITDGQAALNSGSAGNLYIAPGTYSEPALNCAKSGASDALRINILPWPGKNGNVICDGTNGIAYWLQTTGKYITISNSPTSSIFCTRYTGNAVRIQGDSTQIYNLVVSTSGSVSTGGTAILLQADNCRVMGCALTNCYRTGIGIASKTNTLIANCSLSGFTPDTTSGSAFGISVNAAPRTVVTNCTITFDDPGSNKTISGVYLTDDASHGSETNILVIANTLKGGSSPYARNTCNGITVMGADGNVTLSRNTIWNWGHYGVDCGGTTGNESQGVLFERNLAYNNGMGNFAVDGDTVGTTNQIVLRNNISYLTVEPPEGNNYNGGFDFHGEYGSNNISRVAWYNNTAWVSPTVTSTYAAGFWTDRQMGLGTYVLINNVFVSAAGDAFKWQDDFTHNTTTLSNNLFYTTGGKAIRFNFGVPLATYANDHVVGGSAGYFSFDTGKTGCRNGTDPKFSNPPSGFDLMEGSPCIGTGLNLSALFSDDYNGAHREAWDLGAIRNEAIRTGIIDSVRLKGKGKFKGNTNLH